MTIEEALAASEAEPVNDIFTVNPESRTITVPDTEKIFGVFNDGNTERKHFRCPKVVGDSIDLTTLHLYINYQNANGKKYPYLVEDVQPDGDYITFSWLISPDVVAYKGTVKFVLCAKKGTEREWNTTLAEGTVLEGLEATDEVVERHPDIIEQILTRLDNVTEIPQDKVQSAVDQYMTANPISVPKKLSDLQDDATHRTVTDAEKQMWSGKSDFSGSYNDLTDKPTIPTDYTAMTEQINSLKEEKISYRVVGKIAVLPEIETKIACTGIVINTTELLMSELGKTEQLTTTVTPSNTTDVISWKSSNVDVATVTNTGLVKAVGYGTAEITVTCGTQTAICHVNVKQTETEVVSDGVVIPDMHNTGVENSIQMKEINTSSLSGTTRLQMTQQIADTYCNSSGVIEGYHFNGIYVDFNKTITQAVTFKNCKFTGDDKMAYAVAVSAYGTNKGIIFENCEFSHYKSAIASGDWKATFDKCYVHDMMQDAFKINRSDIYIKNSYMHSLGTDTTSHADGVQIENNIAEVTVHIYNCRFDQPYTSGNTENAAIFAKCKDANIILDVQKCYATGGNYTIYALDSKTAKVSGKIECVVGCSSRYGIANIADGVEQNVVSSNSLLVSTIQNGKLYVTNYTNNDRTLKIVTDIEEKTVTIPKSSTYDGNHTQAFSEYPYNVAAEYSAGASWVKCYENGNLIRTQKLGE